ncbi:hypothetical protein [Tenacibaculum agarivorans]|uniref:hypothetical protein n=1 Tax=Tenacibaculum agarivorans TaxID=1908389 RepID=UPI00094B7C07|nr:hypothetical protein [Tenacibaculum agarivorans]
MCDFNQGFILCKCNDSKVIVHHKKSKRNKKKLQKEVQKIEYTWTLFRFIGMSKERELGRYMFPVSDVGNGLTSTFVANELNSRNCFDFKYTPNQGDNLIISKNQSSHRIEFIFRNGKWEEDHYSPFDHEYVKIDNGKIKTNEYKGEPS